VLTAVVAASTKDIEKQLSFLAALLGVTALGTMAISGGVAWLVVSRGLRPLAAVARKIAAMDETDLKQRIADRGVPQEIEPVVNQLNGLLGRLDEAFDRERTLTADVAHELRTPVAEIRAITEVTLSRLRDPEEYRQALGEMLDTIKMLQGLIEKLLVLARLEAGQTKPELQPIAVKPVLLQRWAQVRDRAEARGVAFEDRCPLEATVSADPKLLEVVLSNVLSNAAAYTPAGGQITAQVQRVGQGCQLTILNTGCELGEEEIARVFDRFWRADAARSKSGLNCGLGLTLVRRAMEAMGGKAAASASGKGCFILSLTFDAAEPRGSPGPAAPFEP
jgi:signal transduction histidine kinase